VTLRCPVRGCRRPLTRDPRRLVCSRAHAFDVARSGYVNLLQAQDRRSSQPGDGAATVQARGRVIARGFEAPITDRREKEMADLGFIPLVHQKGTSKAAFFSVQSAQKPKVYDKDAATANARISAQLPYIFAVSRFAHYLKAMMRDKIGSFMSRGQCETFLNNWIRNYSVDDDNAPASVKARNPLREARVDVMEIPGKPGAYRAIAFLRPHFQLDELSVSLRLVADLPPPAK